MQAFDHLVMFKFSVSSHAGGSHIVAVERAQRLVRETSEFAVGVGCECFQLFNYLFSFGEKAAIQEITHRLSSNCAISLYRQYEMRIDPAHDWYHNKLYLCWLLAIADHLAKRSRAPIASEDGSSFSLTQWLTMLEQVHLSAFIEAAFVPTVKVIWPGYGIKSRFPSDINFGKLQQAIERSDNWESALLLLDGDGIKKARADGHRPTLFASHERRVHMEMQQSGKFSNKIMRIYTSRLEIDGLFDWVVSSIVKKIVSSGHVAQYLGGDELVAIAPVDLVADVVRTVCSAAPFEIAFSCGKSGISEFRPLEEGFTLAEYRLGQAKSLTRRDAFNLAP